MRKVCVLVSGFVILLPAWSLALAQTPEPPSPAPAVVTATPLPQVIVVTATPTAPTAPETLWEEHGTAIAGALIGLIFGGVLTWLLKPAFERLGNIAAEKMSAIGSGRGFRKRYLTHLIEEHRVLNIRGLKTRAPVALELERVYVSLHTQVPDISLGRQDLPPMSVGQAMRQHDRLVILGGPGTGKTTLLAYLTLTYARGQASERLRLKEERLPIFVPLRRLKSVLDAADGVGTLPAYLAKWYTEWGMHCPEDFFEQALEDGQCLVLLDGLDEVADEAQRRQMSEWVDRLVTIYPRNRYIITSRPLGYENVPLENDFTVLNIRDFTAEEIRQFATNWCLAVEIAAQGKDDLVARKRSLDAALDLVAAIEASAAIRKLAVNPLLLSIIALVHRYRATLPRRRVELYAECVDVLLGYWDEARGLVGRLTPAQKRAVLQPLALGMHVENQREVPRRKLEERIAGLLPAVQGRPADAANFLDEVRKRSGLLIEVGLGMYAFSHLTFQEYLCARELVDNEKRWALLLEKAGDEWWQEVTLLYVGMAEATPIVRALLAAEGDIVPTRLLLAGQCVSEAVRVADDARREVTRRLETSFATSTKELFLRTGQVLAEVAGKDSVDFFLQVAHDDADRREAALSSLGQMGRQPKEVQCEEVLDGLLTHVREGSLKHEAGLALIRLWNAGPVAELRMHLSPSLFEQTVSALIDVMDSMMVTVPAGKFPMGYDKREVYVDSLRIAQYPVTNAQYGRFVEATGYHPPRHWKNGKCPDGRILHPVIHVSWHDANAYCEWVGKRLPAEEEWEKAARGIDGREYPWGDWEKGRCNTHEGGIEDTTPVGRYSPHGDSPYGCVDMAGNVAEWTASQWKPSRAGHVVRGGSWRTYHGFARCAERQGQEGAAGDSPAGFIGFRCVSPV